MQSKHNFSNKKTYFFRAEIQLLVGAGDLGDLAQHLRHWTGARWLVSLSDEPAGKTLAETKAVAAAERRDTIARTPLVTKIAAIFPGATIEEISAIDAPVNELDKDTESDDEEDTD